MAIQWDATISLGAVINFLTFIVAGIGVYIKLERRLTRIETILELTLAIKAAKVGD